MKKFIALLLALVMIVGLVACGSKSEPAPAEEKKEETAAPAPAEETKEEAPAEPAAEDVERDREPKPSFHARQP